MHTYTPARGSDYGSYSAQRGKTHSHTSMGDGHASAVQQYGLLRAPHFWGRTDAPVADIWPRSNACVPASFAALQLWNNKGPYEHFEIVNVVLKELCALWTHLGCCLKCLKH